MHRLLIALMVLSLAACGINKTVDGDAADFEPPPTTGLGEAPPLDPAPSSSTIPTPSTVGPDEPADPDDEVPEEDVELIVALWDDYTASWDESTDAGFAFLAENSYPDLDLSPEACKIAFNVGPADTYREEVVVDPDTVEPDEDWKMSQGPLVGTSPDGTIYVMSIRNAQYLNDEPIASDRADVHATIVDGRAYFFFTCNSAD